MLQALQRGWQAMIVSLLSNFAGYLIFAYILFYTDKHNVIRLMYLYSCTIAFGAVVGVCLLIYPMLRLYKKSKIQRAQMEQENQNINHNDRGKTKDIKITKTDSKFESNYADLDSTVNSVKSAGNLSPKEYKTKDKESDSDTNETKNVTEL